MVAYREIGKIQLNNSKTETVRIEYNYDMNGIIWVFCLSQDGRKHEVPIISQFDDGVKDYDENYQLRKQKVQQLIKMIEY